jgi:hypothetical protein
MSLEVDKRRDTNGVAEDDNLTVTAEGELVINGHSAVVEKDWGNDMTVRNSVQVVADSYTVKQQSEKEVIRNSEYMRQIRQANLEPEKIGDRN